MVRSGSVFAFFSFLNSGLSFPLALILSAYILPESYGKLSMFNTVSSLLLIVISFNTFGYIAVKYFQVNEKDRSRYLNIVLSCVFFALFLFVIVLLLFGSYISKYTGLSLTVLFVCLLYCIFYTLYKFLLEFFRLEEKAFVYGILTTIYTALNVGLSLYFVIGLTSDWYGRVASQVLVTLVFGSMAVILLIRKGYLKFILPTKEQYKETLKWGVPLIPHDISGWLKQGADRIIINANFASTSVGLFSFAFNFANIITMVASAFNNSNSVYIFKCLSQDAEGSRFKLRKMTLLMMVFFFVLTVTVDVLSYIFVPVFLSNYTDSLIYLPPVSLSAFFVSIYLLFCNYLFYYGKTKQLMTISISIALLHLVLSLIFTRYSVLITAYISAFSSFLQALLVFLYSRKVYKVI